MGYSTDTALEVATRTTYIAAGPVGNVFQCVQGSGGCPASSAYPNFLAADDDNGNLADGTPHMTALFAAFNRHQIACATPAPQNAGCAAGPTAAPASFTAVAGNGQVTLNWSAVSGATRYWVFRTEGHAGCDFGKVLLAEVTGLTYTDTQVANGRAYSYNVVAAGLSSSCFGLASTCATATPTAVADFSLSCNPAALTIAQGGSGPTTCTVQSLSGFAAPVTLSCSNPPAGVTCSYSPGSVTPPAGGNATSTLTISVGGTVAPGSYTVRAEGVSGVLTHGFDIALTVAVVSVAPVTLAVDAGGNGVLQPGETAVTVAPTWRNTGTLSLALTGALSAFTGPSGPTYTIDDAAADYGTIAANSNQPCSNCYAVTVTASTRPTLHWDATALETMTPTDTTKSWVLHVGDSFTDVPASNGFYRFVETILHKGVTGGCAAAQYCPGNATTREQMAAFVLVSKEGAGYNPPACVPPNTFSDVPETSIFCKFIEELAGRGVVAGCAPNLYCPTAAVQRDQMAVFVLRTLDTTLNPPACTTPMFNDVPANDPFCRWIEELARRNVVTGCGNGSYCPTAPVTRDQMGVFLSLTFGLTLYGL